MDYSDCHKLNEDYKEYCKLMAQHEREFKNMFK